jgi:hypothetical protein
MVNLVSKNEFFEVASALPTDYAPLYDAEGILKGHVRMRGLTGDELTNYQTSMQVTKNGQTKVNAKHAMAKLIVLSAINEDNSPFFSSGDMLKLSQMSAKATMPMFEIAQTLSGLSDDDMKSLTEGFDEARNENSDSV